jgi:putative PIN family toxin of toxin-antitoxin system
MPTTPKIVIDANVIVSAGLKPRSAPCRAMLHARAHGVIVMSDEVEAEIRSVIGRKKFLRHAADLKLIVDVVVAGAERCQPTVEIAECRDAKDNKYLALAFAAGASMIITGDDDLLSLHPWRGIEIVAAADYLLR